uniref:Uncharacterized protein n=1 Tax=Lepeophtheirus salmonis TaxID=72036 RepID=A0A0K2T9W4_LEPSM
MTFFGSTCRVYFPAGSGGQTQQERSAMQKKKSIF